MEYTAWDYLEVVALALEESSALQDWAKAQNGKALPVLRGVNYTHPPSEDDAPFIVLDLDERDGGPTSKKDDVHLRAVLGLKDTLPPAANGLQMELAGLRLLADEFAPHALRALRVLRVGELGSVRERYEPADWPLLYCTLFLTITKERPMGSRA